MDTGGVFFTVSTGASEAASAAAIGLLTAGVLLAGGLMYAAASSDALSAEANGLLTAGALLELTAGAS